MIIQTFYFYTSVSYSYRGHSSLLHFKPSEKFFFFFKVNSPWVEQVLISPISATGQTTTSPHAPDAERSARPAPATILGF